MTSNAIVTLYFTFQAELAGIAWRPPANDSWTPPEGLDLGVDLGDFLLWCFKNGYNAGFVKISLQNIDAALATEGLAIVTGVILNRLADQQCEEGKAWNVGLGDEPDPEDGHAILYLKALAKEGERVWATWGQQQRSSHKWFLKCPQQAFGVITDPDKIDPAIYNALVADLKALNGTVESVSA